MQGFAHACAPSGKETRDHNRDGQGTMSVHDSQDRDAREGHLPYLLSFILGGISAWGIGGLLLGLAPLWMLLPAACLGALFGCFMDENIGEAIVLSVIVSLLCYFIYHVGPQGEIFKAGMIGTVCGFCCGKLVIGAWRELPSS